MTVIPGVPEMTAAMFGDADLRRTAPTIVGPLDEPARAEVYPLPRLIEDARRYLASRSYDSEERMVLRWCVDALEKHTTQPPERVTTGAGEATGWRCFHCGDLFTDERCARLHFGRGEDCPPACQIKGGAEQGLLGALRDAEYEASDARQAIADECTEAARAHYAQMTRHNRALRNAEELGYERGVADGRALPAPATGQAAEVARLREAEAMRPALLMCRSWLQHAEDCACRTTEATEDGFTILECSCPYRERVAVIDAALVPQPAPTASDQSTDNTLADAFHRGAVAMQRALAEALIDHLNPRAAAIANGVAVPPYVPTAPDVEKG